MPAQHKFYFLIAAAVLFIAISFFISCSMQDMQSSLHEETSPTQTNSELPTSNIKQNIPYYWDSEEITAQQVERNFSFRQNANLDQVISNLEDNLQFNRNKVAAMFYLAYAYEQLNKNPEAASIYSKLRKTYNNRNLKLYVFNAPRSSLSDKTYMISLYEESSLREYRLTKAAGLLQSIITSNATFGEENKEGFRYSDLASENLSRIKKKDLEPLMSSDQFFRLAEARTVVNSFISACLKDPLSTTEITALLTPDFQATYATTLPAVKSLSEALKIELELITLRKLGGLYYYTFQVVENNLTISVIDNGTNILISKVR